MSSAKSLALFPLEEGPLRACSCWARLSVLLKLISG